jgi:hypothetical protein
MKTKKSPFGENSLPNKKRKKEKKKPHWLPLVQRILEGKFPQKSRHILRGKKKRLKWPNVF